MADQPCYACSHPFPTDGNRCPSCGAPRRPAAKAAHSGRTTIAGFLFLSLFGLTLFQGIATVANPASAVNAGFYVTGRQVAVAGSVVSSDGTPLGNATVSFLDSDASRYATTGADGRYNLSLPAGVVAVRAEAPGFGPVESRLFLTRDRELSFELASGSAERVIRDPSYARVVGFVNACGFILMGIGLLALGGAIAAYRRRNFAMALWAGILGLFGSVPISLLLGALILILVVRSRGEFR